MLIRERGLSMKLFAILPLIASVVSPMSVLAQELPDYLMLANPTTDVVLVYTRSTNREAKSKEWSRPTLIKPKDVGKLVLTGPDPTDVAIMRHDGVYFVARDLPLRSLVNDQAAGKRPELPMLQFAPAQVTDGKFEYDTSIEGWKIKPMPYEKDTRLLLLAWEDVKYDPPRKPKLPPPPPPNK
jgi:hypothetical protein